MKSKEHNHVETLCQQNFFRNRSLLFTIYLPIKLNKNKIPNFQYIRIIHIHQRCSISTSNTIKMDFSARSTWPHITHFPKIIFHSKWKHSIGMEPERREVEYKVKMEHTIEETIKNIKLPNIQPYLFCFFIRGKLVVTTKICCI